MVMKIGVLALQGNFAEHIETLKKCKGIDAVEVRLPEDLKDLSGLVIPGGESTTISKLLATSGLDKTILEKQKSGMGIFGTCAGAVIISKKITNPSRNNTEPFGMIDIEIARNDYGRQVDSFETDLEIKDIGEFHAVFIRAPIIHNIGDGVEVLAEFEGKPVLVKQDKIMACTFHPELTDRTDVHENFIKSLEG
jgi:pyridoxal 5'-phosphate synthase pdxT subunit